MWDIASLNRWTLTLCLVALVASFLWGWSSACGGSFFSITNEGPACNVELLSPASPADVQLDVLVPTAIKELLALIWIAGVTLVLTRPVSAPRKIRSPHAVRAIRSPLYRDGMRIPYLCPTHGP